MFAIQPPDDGRGKLPEAIKIRAPRGFSAMVKSAAEAERMSVSEFIRRAVEARTRDAGQLAAFGG